MINRLFRFRVLPIAPYIFLMRARPNYNAHTFNMSLRDQQFLLDHIASGFNSLVLSISFYI